jgi:hypothetical protein
MQQTGRCNPASSPIFFDPSWRCSLISAPAPASRYSYAINAHVCQASPEAYNDLSVRFRGSDTELSVSRVEARRSTLSKDNSEHTGSFVHPFTTPSEPQNSPTPPPYPPSSTRPSHPSLPLLQPSSPPPNHSRPIPQHANQSTWMHLRKRLVARLINVCKCVVYH